MPFFVRFTNIPVYQSLVINDISVKDLLREPDEKYGDYGSIITLEIENHRIRLKDTGEIKERAKRRIKKHAEVIINKDIAEILSNQDLTDSAQVSELVRDVIAKFCQKHSCIGEKS